jgi:hypothetical protein
MSSCSRQHHKTILAYCAADVGVEKDAERLVEDSCKLLGNGVDCLIASAGSCDVRARDSFLVLSRHFRLFPSPLCLLARGTYIHGSLPPVDACVIKNSCS